MSLADHPYRFVCDRGAFFRENGKIAALLENAVIERVYAVWNCINETWFVDAPMRVKTSAGMLPVHVKSGTDIAIGWNDLSLSEKPVWFDRADAGAIEGLGWTEDLEWRDYRAVSGIRNERIGDIGFHAGGDGEAAGVGIGLACSSGKCLWICDAGDVIAARMTEP